MPHTNQQNIRILLVGAGKAGELLSKDIQDATDSSLSIVGFIDDDTSKKGSQINGIEVLGTVDDLHDIVSSHDIDELFIVIPSKRGSAVRRIIENTFGQKLVYKILPRLSEILLQDYSEDYLRHIRKVRPEDLLGGEILKSDQ